MNLSKALESQGVSIRVTREPGGTPLGDKIRHLLLHDSQLEKISSRAELLLFLASRAEHVEKVIIPSLEKGAIVLCDRYIDSTIAYQAYGRQQSPHEIENLCRVAVPLIPDLTLCLDIDPETAYIRLQERQGSHLDNIERSGHQFHERVREGFKKLSLQHPERIALLDAKKSQSELCKEAIDLLQKRFPERGFFQ